MKFVALFRGINVGKSVQVSMKDLKVLLEGLGLRNVTTYLNSGNALFEADSSSDEIAGRIEAALELQYGQKIRTLVKTGAEMVRIAALIPPEWNNDETQQTYVAYLFPEADTPGLVDELPVRREYMTIVHDQGCLVWNILRANYNKSHVTKLVAHRSYSRMTTRNSNTARKLAELCADPT